MMFYPFVESWLMDYIGAMIFSFSEAQTLGDFQEFVEHVYALPDDRLYSISDILAHEQRFAMRALKGIRKGDANKLKLNLLISLSWLMAIANRLHIDSENEVWKRFPRLCSYCGERPCACKTIKPTARLKVKIDNGLRPKSLAEMQVMFDEIYPTKSRMLADAGVHLAEEVGEVSEAVHNYLGQHKQKQFDDVKLEIADFISCVFGLANSAGMDIAEELGKMYSNNCHVCHEAPCVCNFSEVAQIKT
jgi:NTP pyrophosphatase (non-canonical NTP hydrolase)